MWYEGYRAPNARAFAARRSRHRGATRIWNRHVDGQARVKRAETRKERCVPPRPGSKLAESEGGGGHAGPCEDMGCAGGPRRPLYTCQGSVIERMRDLSASAKKKKK